MYKKSATVRHLFSMGVGVLVLLTQIVSPIPVSADHTPDPTYVAIAGSFQSALGCPGDWQPDCPNSELGYDAEDDVWQAAFTLPAGNWEYKAALNDSWDENYGANAVENGANIALNLAASTGVKFYYDHKSHWATDNVNSIIATVAGSFQSELGCGGDWLPSCLRSWMQDPDGDGVYTFSTDQIPAGSYEFKVALDEGWTTAYPGSNVPFTSADGDLVTFTYDSGTTSVNVTVTPAGPGYTVALVGDLQSELGCPGNWDPACSDTELNYDENDDVWQGVFTPPAGSYEYKVALNDTWDENYGAGGASGGANINLSADGSSIKFYYDHKSHWVTDNKNSVIAVAAGDFQSELGCSGDWDPGCLRSWLQDVDGDGIYTLETTTLPTGNYQGKVAINESWDENYGAGGSPGGANILFFVPFDGAKVVFEYNAATHVLVIKAGFAPDDNIAWDGLRHDSRDLLYRTPGGAVPAGTDVLIRFRTFHNDVTAVSLRVYDINDSGQHIIPMTLATTGVSCYQPGLEDFTCDFWQASLNETSPNNLWYRFIVSDGSDTDYYADDTPALDGGLGAVSDDAVDNSYALMFYDPTFIAPDWAQSASIYQIFPDRFRDGRSNNNPKTGDVRYDDPVLRLSWSTLPEGYCRNYSDAATNCPWRYDATPPDWSPLIEGARGRDYFGGDIAGVTQELDYLSDLGVTTIYFNPIFASQSNHGYDTSNYRQIDPGLGTYKEFKTLVSEADKRGIRIVLDGVFNHMSSDSPFFDRYHHYDDVGACESAQSPYRNWFYFQDVPPGTGTCVDSNNLPNSATYTGWFGFDSIPVINKSLPEVQQYFLTSPNSISKLWLKRGASGWRMDVMGDASFPDGYWETFRGEVKNTNPEAFIISETWQKDSTLLRMLRGDRADTTMNYRLRDAVLGLLAPQNFDSKGFADSGHSILPSEFASRMESIREDYPDAAYYSLMNLLDSHDTERLRWTLTPADTETTADKELNETNVAEGKLRQQIASLIQFTVPGAPTVFYGDEVGMTGDDDPDDRRTFPWADTGGSPDQDMFAHYQILNNLRSSNDVLVSGDFRFLLADDAAGVVVYGRKTADQVAIIVVNRSGDTQSITVPVAGYLPDGVTLNKAYEVGDGGAGSVSVLGGAINGSVGPMSAAILLSGNVDLQPTEAPSNLRITNEGSETVSLEWDAVSDTAGYTLYRSPVSGGGWVKLNNTPLIGTDYTDTGLENARNYFYVVTSLDSIGNESVYSNEVNALPHLLIGWANLQWPPDITHTISAVERTGAAYGQVWIGGATDKPGATPTLFAQLGFGPEGSNPDGNPNWTWEYASFNVDAGNNDEFMASMLPDSIGTFDYVYRYSTTNGRDWLYADINGPIPTGDLPPNPGKLTVASSGDLTPPAAPTNLLLSSTSPTVVSLAWDAHPNTDGDLAGFEVYRDGGLLATVLNASAVSFTDTAVIENTSYDYYILAIDTSYNRSAASNTVNATASPRTVSVTFNVTVPSTTDGTSRSVYIAGFLDRLDGNLPQWDPAGVVLTQINATTWSITLTGYESTQIEYKYTLGDWEHVEKDGICGEVNNRLLTLSYGTDGNQTVNDTVLNWRNVAPCGN